MKPTFAILVVISGVFLAAAQESESFGPSAAVQNTPPATLDGQDIRRVPLSDIVTPNYISGGISIAQMYTDNAELTSTGKISDLSYDIAPNLELNHFTPRVSYDLGISAGFLVNRTLSGQNHCTQSAGFDTSYGLSRFVTLRLSDSFTNSSGLWSSTNSGTAAEAGPGIGTVQQPNNALFTYGRFMTNTVLGELTAQLDANSFVGARGTQSYLSYPSETTDSASRTLYGGNSYTAELFYNHQFTARNWGGITARAERFDINASIGRTDTASVLFFYAFTFRPSTSISVFSGPELSVTAVPQGIPNPIGPFDHRMWVPAGGAVFNTQGRRFSASASFTHQVNNGGGLFSAVTLDSASAEILAQFGKRLRLGPGFTYSESSPIVTSPTVRTYSGRFQLMYEIRSSSLVAGYGRDDWAAPSGNLPNASANRFWVGFSYSILRPLGR